MDDEEKSKQLKKDLIKQEKIKRDKVLTSIQSFLDTEGGRIWIWNLLEDSHIFHTSFAENDSLTNFREGERNIGLRVLIDVLEARPRALEFMREENENG